MKSRTPLKIGLVALILLQSGCSTNPYKSTNKVYRKEAEQYAKILRESAPNSQLIDSLASGDQSWTGAVNLSIRKPNYVIIHHTAQNSTEQTIKTFTTASTQVSAHYVIGRDGKVVQMLNDYLRAHHAGVSKWGTTTDLNSSSIGIELDNNGSEPFPDAQIKSLCAVLESLKRRYKIPTPNFIAHADIAPTRKPDPSNFPWKTLAEKGYGLWYDRLLLPVPTDFDPILALRVIGYDISNRSAAIIAFKRHFIQTNLKPEFNRLEKAILYNLYQKYL